MKTKFVQSYKELDVYQRAMGFAVTIFEATKKFPNEEKYSLIDQIRRSSRSVCANLGEAWRKRRYKAAFIAKLSDAETEVCETQVWTDIAYRCKYIDSMTHQQWDQECETLMGQIVTMMQKADKWVIRS